MIKQLLKNMFNVEDITLLELYNLTKKEFIIIGTNFTNGIETAFSYKTHPNMSVITALRITISIPYMFTPVLYEGDYYVDGGITNNFPINWCNQETTLGIYVKGTVKNNINNIIDIYSGCFCIMFDASVDMVVKDFNNIITIVNTEEMNEKGFSNFDLTDDYKKYLLDLGYSCAKIWYDEYNNLNEL
jgi:predicted acylesterase/phospholipase RssA